MSSDCPHCGCNDVTVTRRPDPSAWFARSGLARCNFCGLSFAMKAEDLPESTAEPINVTTPPPLSTPVDETVTYQVLRCPSCRADDIKTTSTRRPVRHHKCRACNHSFKSVEQS